MKALPRLFIGFTLAIFVLVIVWGVGWIKDYSYVRYLDIILRVFLGLFVIIWLIIVLSLLSVSRKGHGTINNEHYSNSQHNICYGTAVWVANQFTIKNKKPYKATYKQNATNN